jgi:predicted P-loop ATPase
LAFQNKFHPVRDYLSALNWDGKPRVDGWLTNYAGAQDTAYSRAVGTIMLIAAVRRVRQPGCKFDEVVVLEGKQGAGKSTLLKALASNDAWFTDDVPLNADTRRLMEAIEGAWICEAAELKGMRQNDVESQKAILSRQVDKGRAAYGRLPKYAPRQCIIVGTTNNSAYLRDGTGNRRFWPIAIERCDVAGISRDVDQLWAEAATREARGESIRLPEILWPKAAAEQSARSVDDPFFNKLDDTLGEANGKIRTESLWKILGILPGQNTQTHNARLGDVMRALGWTKDKQRFQGYRNPQHCYVKGDVSQEINIGSYYQADGTHALADDSLDTSVSLADMLA